MENNAQSANPTADFHAEDTTYDIFILAVSFMALIILVLFVLPGVSETATEIAFALDTVFSLIFLYDFFRSLARAPDRRKYFFKRGGWLDLLGSIPIFPILRFLRIVRMFRIYRSLSQRTFRDLWRDYKANQAESAFWTTILITILLLTFTSFFIIPFEAESPDAQIKEAGQALWWSVVTITTVGYGDLVPVTESGQILATLLMTVGVILVSVMTSFITSNLMIYGDKEEQERKKRLDEGVKRMNERFKRLENGINKSNERFNQLEALIMALKEDLKADQKDL